MDGLVLSGGADLDPALYDAANEASVGVEPGRDALERLAWDVSRQRDIPVLGICRGFQAINVFSGGRLLQDVPSHAGDGEGAGRHPLRLEPGSRLARILRPTGAAGVLNVNSSHHQAVRPSDLARGLTIAGTSPYPGGQIVEALESVGPREFVVGVQSHPERTESTPREFERLWAVFVDAARGSARGLRIG